MAYKIKVTRRALAEAYKTGDAPLVNTPNLLGLAVIESCFQIKSLAWIGFRPAQSVDDVVQIIAHSDDLTIRYANKLARIRRLRIG